MLGVSAAALTRGHLALVLRAGVHAIRRAIRVAVSLQPAAAASADGGLAGVLGARVAAVHRPISVVIDRAADGVSNCTGRRVRAGIEIVGHLITVGIVDRTAVGIGGAARAGVRAGITTIAVAVPVGVGLGGIGQSGAVVHAVGRPVAIGVEVHVATIALTWCGLGRIGRAAVVAVGRAVQIGVDFDVAAAAGSGSGLVGVVGAAVEVIQDSIAIPVERGAAVHVHRAARCRVLTGVAGGAHVVAVLVRLLRVGQVQAVVAGVRDRVTVEIRLAPVRHAVGIAVRGQATAGHLAPRLRAVDVAGVLAAVRVAVLGQPQPTGEIARVPRGSDRRVPGQPAKAGVGDRYGVLGHWPDGGQHKHVGAVGVGPGLLPADVHLGPVQRLAGRVLDHLPIDHTGGRSGEILPTHRRCGHVFGEQLGGNLGVEVEVILGAAVGVLVGGGPVGVGSEALGPCVTGVAQLDHGIGDGVQVDAWADVEVPSIGPDQLLVHPVAVPGSLLGVVLAVVRHRADGVQPAQAGPLLPIGERPVRTAAGKLRGGITPGDHRGAVLDGPLGGSDADLPLAAADQLVDGLTAEVVPLGIARGWRCVGAVVEPAEAGQAAVREAGVGRVAGVGLGVADVVPMDPIHRVVGDQLTDDADQILLHLRAAGVEDVVAAYLGRAKAKFGPRHHQPLWVGRQGGVSGWRPESAGPISDHPAVHLDAPGVGLLDHVGQGIEVVLHERRASHDVGLPVGPVGARLVVVVAQHLGNDRVVAAGLGRLEHGVDLRGVLHALVEHIHPEGPKLRGLARGGGR